MKESKLKERAIAIIVIAVVLASPAVLWAANPSYLERVSTTVSYADLNIETEAGAKVLYRRLQRASKEVCGVESYKSLGSINRVQQVQSCYRETLSNAVEQIDNQNLTRIHAS